MPTQAERALQQARLAWDGSPRTPEEELDMRTCMAAVPLDALTEGVAFGWIGGSALRRFLETRPRVRVSPAVLRILPLAVAAAWVTVRALPGARTYDRCYLCAMAHATPAGAAMREAYASMWQGSKVVEVADALSRTAATASAQFLPLSTRARAMAGAVYEDEVGTTKRPLPVVEKPASAAPSAEEGEPSSVTSSHVHVRAQEAVDATVAAAEPVRETVTEESSGGQDAVLPAAAVARHATAPAAQSHTHTHTGTGARTAGARPGVWDILQATAPHAVPGHAKAPAPAVARTPDKDSSVASVPSYERRRRHRLQAAQGEAGARTRGAEKETRAFVREPERSHERSGTVRRPAHALQ